jgi:hypothetical protein
MHFTWIYNGDFERLVFRFPKVFADNTFFIQYFSFKFSQ